MTDSVDVVVVGAGLAGLASAHQLRDLNVVVLEQESRAGGRVLTIKNPYSTVDLGACFAVGPDVFPKSDTDEKVELEVRLPERGPIGIFHEGKLVMGDSAWDCLDAMSWDAESRAALEAFRDGRLRAEALPPKALSCVNAFFKQIHPGDIRDYISERQRDALAPLYPDHYPGGNGAAVNAYLAALGESVRVELGCSVTAIDEGPDGVTVTYSASESGEARHLRAKAVIVATPADVARRLVRPTYPSCAAFLETVGYRRYTSVGLVLDAPDLPRFRFIVTAESPLGVLMQQAAPDQRYRTLLCYYADPFAETVGALDDEELFRRTLQHVNVLVSGTYDQAQIAFSAVRRWRVAGTVLSPAYATTKAQTDGQATDRIFLAGDYLSPDPIWGYGTVDAVLSGRATATVLKSRIAF